MYINYKKLYDLNLKDEDYHIMQKIFQNDFESLNKHIYNEDEFEQRLESLIDKDILTRVKSVKDKTKSLRLSKKGKDLFYTLHLSEEKEGSVDLCDELCEIFESYGIETGNKRSVLENLNWFLGKSDFTFEEIKESVEEWLGNGYKMWLTNVLWDSKKASVFTTMKSRTLSQSPLYEFMRRKFNKKW